MAIPDPCCRPPPTMRWRCSNAAMPRRACSASVLCAVGFNGDHYAMTPFGHLCDGNPYEIYVPPDADVIV